MPYCCVPSCRSGYSNYMKKLRAENQETPHFFRAPNEKVLQIWSMKIKRGDRQLTMSDRVCSHHFLPSDVDLYFETRLVDGTVQKIPRDRVKLKDGAVPCIFEGYPSYYNKILTKRRAPIVRDIKSPKKSKKIRLVTIDSAPPSKINPHELNQSDGIDLPVQFNELPNENLQGPVPESECELATTHLVPETINLWSCDKIGMLRLPAGWVVCNRPETSDEILIHVNDDIQIDKSIRFTVLENVEIRIRGVRYEEEVPLKIDTVDVAQTVVKNIDQIRVCCGTQKRLKPYSAYCSGYAKLKRCQACSTERERIRKREARVDKLEAREREKKRKTLLRLKSLNKYKTRLILKVNLLKSKIIEAMLRCETIKKESLLEAISQLPETHQEAVKACFEAAKKKGTTGRRYTMEWAYECLLMRIKSPKLYEHIRSHNILPLPANSTLSNYIKNMGGAFGLQPLTFELIKKKMADSDEAKRHGMIMIDEMKLTPGMNFDSSTLSVEGILQLDETSPADKTKSLGDHALVISFQPFQGKWVQAIAAYLTKGNATAETLTHLIIEVVLLLEQSGLRVDGVVTDGAQWNRSMWKKFGVTESNPHCNHPSDSERRLWFLSDFPHLMKCMRNCFLRKKLIETSEGNIRLDHWKAVVEQDSLKKGGLKECPRLTQDHLNPDPWQKMNVAMAWQFWSGSSAAGMISYKMQGVYKLQDCDISAEFTKKVNAMADAMNTNTPLNALRLDSPESRVIADFLQYFKDLKAFANSEYKRRLQAAASAQAAFVDTHSSQKVPSKRQALKESAKENPIFSESTDFGLIVTLTATLEIAQYLIEKCGFNYLMTARLNQDALERFFGLVRQSCGPNTHPEPKVFSQLFRLLSMYSLVKPVKGSNITGGSMLQTLFKLKDFQTKTSQERKDELTRRLDEIVSNGNNLDHISELIHEVDHSYLDESIDMFALNYVGGFTARHCQKFSKDCQECQNCLKKPADQHAKNDSLITLKTKNWLTYPSDQLMHLLRTLEDQILRAYGHNEPQNNFLFLVLDRLEDVPVIQIGCQIHRTDLTKAVIKFYLIMRMHFLCRQWNKEAHLQMKKKQKGLRKQAHLV